MQLAELLAESLQIPDDQQAVFVQFARGVSPSGTTGLELIDSDLQGQTAAPEEGPLLPDSSRPPLPHNLPAQATPFVGRTAELAALQEFLGHPDVRLINIIGPGGMGKTRLALAAAGAQLENADRFDHGVYFVALAGVESADFLAQAIAEAIGFQFSGAGDPQLQLLRFLHPKKMLLVLDNFEHLLAGVSLVEGLIREAPGTQLLVSSREKLNLQSEQLFPISGLAFPQEGEPLTEVVQFSAVQLFLQRARRARPRFRLTEENRDSVADICRMVNGMPLGIVLAAAWLDTLTPAEIAAEIGRDLDFLATEMSDVPARQRSLHAAFNYSWRMLAPEEREIYSQLSVFRGGFSFEAATAVSGASLRDLQALVNKSLLTRSRTAGQEGTRYGIHELLRQFAALELAERSDLQDAARDRHSAYFCALLQEHEPRWHSAEQLDTLATVSQESDNINAAWRHAFNREAWADLVRAVDSWGQYHLWQGLYADGLFWSGAIEECLATKDKSELVASAACSSLLIMARAWQGVFCSATRDALVKLEESVQLLERLDPAAGRTRSMKAFVLRQMTWRIIPIDLQRAFEHAAEALQLSSGLADRWQIAESHFYLGSLTWRLGRIPEGRRHTEMALAIYEDLGDRRMQVLANTILAWVIQSEGDFAEAERLRSWTRDLCLEVGDRPNQVHCEMDGSTTLQLRGKYHEALRSAERGVALSVEYGFREKEGLARSVLASALMHLGRYDDARREFDRALALVQETGHRDVESGIWVGKGYLALLQADSGRQARACFAESLRLNKDIQDEIFKSDRLIGSLLASCLAGQESRAKQLCKQCLEHVINVRNHMYLAETLGAVAFYLKQLGGSEEASRIWLLASGQPLVANSRWYADLFGRDFPGPQSEPILASTADLWQTAESLLAELS